MLSHTTTASDLIAMLTGVLVGLAAILYAATLGRRTR